MNRCFRTFNRLGTRLALGIAVAFFVQLLLFNEAHSQTIKVRVHQSNKPIKIEGSELKLDGKPVTSFLLERLQGETEPYWSFSSGQKISTPTVELQGSTIFVDGKQWPSPVTFVAGRKSKINAVISLPLEEYIMGVVAGEMPASWPLEALMAQAIASRSYILAQLNAQSKQLFDTDSSQNNQVYKWVQDRKKNQLWRVEEAVRKTEGMILLDKNDRPLWAYYHADCGGHTEEPHVVWNNQQFFWNC